MRNVVLQGIGGGSAQFEKFASLFAALALLIAAPATAPCRDQAGGEAAQTTQSRSFFRKVVGRIPLPHWGQNPAGERLVPLTRLEAAELQARIAGDLQAIGIYRKGLRGVLDYVARHPELFPTESTAGHMLDARGRDAVRGAWQSFYDYCLALDALAHYYNDYWRLRGEARADALLVRRAAFLAQWRAALEFIAATRHDPTLDTLLNESIPGSGLPEDSFTHFKVRCLNSGNRLHWAALETVARVHGTTHYPEARQAVAEDAARLAKLNAGPAQLMALKDAVNLLQHGGHDAWFPVQAGVADVMGRTKVYRWGRTLIGSEQIAGMLPRLDPGDVLLERREWHLSNMGLPGFWTHAAIYIGTPAERRDFFNESEVKTWANSQGADDFESLLRARCPEACDASIVPDADGRPPRVIEAIAAGVVFTSLEHSAGADSVAVLRPRLSKKDKAMALLRAFHYSGRPYDYDFDFLTDSALVCTELVYKSFEPGSGCRGLKFELQKLLDRQLMPANEIARQFHESVGTPAQQFDFVLFLDGLEPEGRAVESPLDAFRQSWRRPKWHAVAQDLNQLNPAHLVTQ